MIIPKNIEQHIKQIRTSVRHERIANNLSQKEFSEFIDIKYATYRAFEQDGKISLINFLLIINGLNKYEEFKKFIDSFEYESGIEHSRVDKRKDKYTIFKPIVEASQKQIVLDKNIFGNELFYSVDSGHIYEVSRFISIMLSGFNDERIMLLLKYFGVKRLKPYILKEKNIQLLKKFNKHVAFINKAI